MTDTQPLPTPIFYETLAEAAHCTPADAYEHYHTDQGASPRGRAHPVELFLENYCQVQS